jgi:gp32 DNA binding protein like
MDWNSGTKEGKELASLRRRKLSYISNILVLKHDARPADVGQVFLYQYGKKIYEKINEKMNPSFADMARFSPFDPTTGANFHLRVTKVAGFPNYDKSDFDRPGPYAATPEQMEEIWKKCYSLEAEIAPDKFKSYEELQRKLESVLTGAERAPRPGILERVGVTASPAIDVLPTDEDSTPPFDVDTPIGGEPKEMDWFLDLASKKK